MRNIDEKMEENGVGFFLDFELIFSILSLSLLPPNNFSSKSCLFVFFRFLREVFQEWHKMSDHDSLSPPAGVNREIIFDSPKPSNSMSSNLVPASPIDAEPAITSVTPLKKKKVDDYNPLAELNKLIASFEASDKVRVELRPVADHNCWGDPSKALFRGADTGSLSLVRAGLCSGMDPDSFFRGQTPLMYAAERGHTAVCLLLIANGANVNIVDKYNRTALHYACRNKHVGCAAALMDGGARNDIECDLGGETPSDYARCTGDRELIRFCNFYKANVQEIREVALKAAVAELRDGEGLALTAVQPVVSKGPAAVGASGSLKTAAEAAIENDEEEEL